MIFPVQNVMIMILSNVASDIIKEGQSNYTVAINVVQHLLNLMDLNACAISQKILLGLSTNTKMVFHFTK